MLTVLHENQLRTREIGLLWIDLKHWFLKDPRGSFVVDALLASLGFVKGRKESLNVPHAECCLISSEEPGK